MKESRAPWLPLKPRQLSQTSPCRRGEELSASARASQHPPTHATYRIRKNNSRANETTAWRIFPGFAARLGLAKRQQQPKSPEPTRLELQTTLLVWLRLP